ncbi:MAG: VWA domain-containing protein, partial [Shewanella sp.]
MTHPLYLLNAQLVSISLNKQRHNAAVSALTLAIILGLSGCMDKQTESESRTELATQANEAAEQQAALVQRVEA